jgi:hypothetical protein
MTSERASLRDTAVVAALVSALVGGVTSVFVTKMQTEAAHEQAAAVFVGIAVQVLTSHEPVNAETRAWAEKIINHYSPVPLTPDVQLPKVIHVYGTAGESESIHAEATVIPRRPIQRK